MNKQKPKLKRSESIAKIWQHLKPIMLANANRAILANHVSYRLTLHGIYIHLEHYTATPMPPLYHLSIRHHGIKVANLCLDETGVITITSFKRGDWEDGILSISIERRAHNFPIPVDKYIADIRAGLA